MYITHDLTTAYQLSRTILVMYQGEVVEVGDVERVIKAPKHPYTQLLVGSIPLPDTSRRWGGEDGADGADGAETDAAAGEENGAPHALGGGCAFAGRCPHVMDRCRRQTPPLVRTDEGRAAACFLHEEAEVLSEEQVAALSHGGG